MSRHRVSSGTDWESKVGYSRAIQVGSQVYVSGTTATDEDGGIVGEGDVYAQTERALQNIDIALSETDASLADVVRTRIYVIDIDDWEDVGDAHRTVFGDIRPATSMVEVNRLINPELLVEIEAVAVIGE